MGPGEDSGPAPPEDAKIEKLLKSLSEDQLYTLILLMYVGRGDFSVENLSRGYETMKEAFPTRDFAIAQMTGNITLAEYLTDAIQEVKKHHIDLDSLNFSSTAGGVMTAIKGSLAVPSKALSVHLDQLLRNATELDRIHTQLRTGFPGRQYGLASLNPLPL